MCPSTQISRRFLVLRQLQGLREANARLTDQLQERNLASEALLRDREYHLALLQSAPALIWRAGLDAKCDWFNATWLAFTGRSMEQEAGNGWAEGVHPEDLQRCLDIYLAAFAAREAFSMEYRLRHQDGGFRWILDNGLPYYSEQGVFAGYVGYCFDMTERRELENRLAQVQKMESVGSLAGGVSHDINNVLAAILSLSSAHRAGLEPGEPLAKSLDTIIQACVRGRDVVRRLLYFARKDLETEGPVDLNALIQEIAQLLESTSRKRIRILTELQEALEPVEGDAGALSHALMNLGLNALDAMPEGGTLVLQTRRTPGGGLQVSVKDTGEGMSPEVKQKATEPFFTTKPVGKGTGLGLAMVYGTMLAHRGSLEIVSEPGHGCEIILQFPAPPEGSAPPIRTRPAPGAAAPDASTALRILLVDDDELIRASVGPLLQMLGHTVHAAEGGLEALACLEGGLEVDLVILDMNMPGLNGAQTLPRVLALRPGLTVLMATGYSDQDLPALMAERPRVHSIRKPFSLDEIQAKLLGLKDRSQP